METRVQKAIATLVLAAAAPLATAVPVLFTSTSVGVTINTPYSHPDIAAGSSYELVMRMQFDTDDLMVEDHGDGTSWETVWAPASFTFTVGGQTFEVANATSYNRLGAMFGRDDISGAPFLNVSISFYGADGSDHGRVQNGIMLDEPAYSLTHLLDQPQQLSFAAPFSQSAGVTLWDEASAPALGPFWMNADTTTIVITAVPEPASVAMLGAGLALVAGAMTRKRRAASGTASGARAHA